MRNLLIFNTALYLILGGIMTPLLMKFEFLWVFLCVVGWMCGNCIIYVNRKHLK